MDKTHVLIVDDELSILRFVGAGLRAEGYEISEASDGQEALRVLGTVLPDLVLLDISMPKLNGFEVCKVVHKRYPVLPIIMLSALADTIDKVKSLSLGADDYIVKPFGVNELLARIRAVLQRSTNRAKAES